MALLALGIILILVGIVLGFTNAFGFAAIGGSLVWLGWVCIGIGVLLAIVHLFTRRRTTVVERRYRDL
jgi:hypothetical protein